MTPGTIEQLRPGHILNFIYLFRSEAADGRVEGVKERPVIVIDAHVPTNRVYVLAVTTKGDPRTGAIPLPHDVARACGLSLNSSVLVSEYNHFDWPGFDIRPIANGYIMGRLPPGFTAKIRALAANAAGVNRD